MSTTINGVTVRLERNPDDWRKYQITVLVASRKRPGLKTTCSVDPGKAASPKQLMEGIAAAAAAGTEQLGKKYKDNIDHSCAIRDALAAFGEECRFVAEMKKSLPEKLARLKNTASLLNDRERDVLERMTWLSNRGENLTREESEWVAQKIAAIHGASL